MLPRENVRLPVSLAVLPHLRLIPAQLNPHSRERVSLYRRHRLTAHTQQFTDTPNLIFERNLV